MATTTHPEYNDQTEALEVARAFASHIHGKTVIVTGVNKSGIGFSTAEAFASQSPAHLILAGRNPTKIQECSDALKLSYPNVDYRPLKLDLSSQKAVRAAAAEVLSWKDIPSVDFLVNSAGVMLLPERSLTEDGIEMQFGTNHIGHFLFTCLVMPKLIAAAEKTPKGATRVINVSSLSPTHAKMRWSDINFDKKSIDLPKNEQPSYDLHRQWGVADPENASYIPLEGYNQSKVANILFGIALNKRVYEKCGILSVGLHPGIIQTELARSAEQKTIDALGKRFKTGEIAYRSLGAGSSTSLVAALDPKLRPGEPSNGKENYGSYMIDCQVSDRANPFAESSSEAEKLWELSEKLVHQRFAW